MMIVVVTDEDDDGLHLHLSLAPSTTTRLYYFEGHSSVETLLLSFRRAYFDFFVIERARKVCVVGLKELG